MSVNRKIFHNSQISLQKYVQSKGKHVLNSVKTYRRVNSGDAKNWGTEVRFYIPRQGNQYLKCVNLRLDLPALTGFSGGSFVRWCNNVLLRAFDRFELWSGGQMILQRFPDEITYNILPNIKYEQWQKMSEDIAWDESTTSRNTKAASAQNLVIDLKYIFDILQKPFPIHLMKDEQQALEVRCIFKNNQDRVIQTDHTTRPDIQPSDLFLECTYGHQPMVSKFQVEAHKASYKKNKIGSQWYSHEYKRRNHPVQAGAGVEQDIEIRQFENKSLNNIIFLVRDTADLTTAYARDYDDNLKAVTSFQIKDGSDNLYYKEAQITDTEYRKFLLDSFNFCGVDKVYNRNSYYIYFGEDASKEYDHKGVKEFCGAFDTHPYNDLRLNLYLADTVSAKTIDIIATESKRIAIVAGNLKILH